MIEWLMNVEQFVKWEQAKETEALGENSQDNFVHHKSHTTWSDITNSLQQIFYVKGMERTELV